MAIPLLGSTMKPLLDAYREAWLAAGHPGSGRVMLAFHMFCDSDRERARALARGPIDDYLHSIYEAASDWTVETASKDYAGYDKIIAGLAGETFDFIAANGGVWVGTPDEIVDQVAAYRAEVGHFDVASLQVNFASPPYAEAVRSVELFGREVLPRLAELDPVAVCSASLENIAAEDVAILEQQQVMIATDPFGHVVSVRSDAAGLHGRRLMKELLASEAAGTEAGQLV
jgi:hypothetical protein